MRDDNLAKDRLVVDAQRQVRDLLKFKEEAHLAKTEIKLLSDKLAAKEEELARRDRMLSADRDDKDHSIIVLQNRIQDMQANHQAAMQRLDDRLREALNQNIALKRELEHKDGRISKEDGEIAALKRQLQAERDRVEEHQGTISRYRTQIAELENKIEDNMRNSVKADAGRSALQNQLHEKEKELEHLREEFEHLKKKKNELLIDQTDKEAKNTALRHKIDDLTQELTAIPKLKQEISTLLTSRDEISSLRHVMEESEIAMSNERSYRRTLELDKEQLHLKIQSLQEDLANTERELHQAQVDAAERVSLRRELGERAAALDLSQTATHQLQDQVADLKDALRRESHDKEYLESVLTSRISHLRRWAEEAIHAHANNTVEEPSFRSAVSPSRSRYRHQDSTDDGKAELLCSSALAPLETALRELITTTQDLRRNLHNAQKQLNEERSGSSSMESELRTTSSALAQQQLRAEDLQGQLKNQETKNHDLTNQLHSITATSHENLSLLGMTLDLQEPSWEGIQVAVQKAVESRNNYRRQSEKLTASLAETETKLAAEKMEHKDDLQEMKQKHDSEMRTLKMEHGIQMDETSKTQKSLNEALSTALHRHEATVKELKQVQKSYEESVESHSQAEERCAQLKRNLEQSKSQIAELEGELKHEKTCRAEVQHNLDNERASHQATRDDMEELRMQAVRLSERLSGYHDAVRVLVRAVFGLRTAVATALEQRNVLQLYGRHQEQALNLIMAEMPDPIRRVRPTMRVVAIAILVANRLARTLRVVRGRGSIRFQRPRSVTSYDKLVFPPISDVAVKQFVLPEPTDSLSSALQQLLVQFEVEGSPRRRQESTLFQRIASSSFRNRLSPQGPTALARAVSNAYNKQIRDQREKEVSAKQEMSELRKKTTSLQRDLQEKEELTRRASQRLEQLQAEKEAMVDRRSHESLASELTRTKTDLERQVNEKRRLESLYGQLQNRELDLISKHTALQTEARNLALDLARTGSMVRSQSRTGVELRGSWNDVPEVVSRGDSPTNTDGGGDFRSSRSISKPQASILRPQAVNPLSDDADRRSGYSPSRASYTPRSAAGGEGTTPTYGSSSAGQQYHATSTYFGGGANYSANASGTSTASSPSDLLKMIRNIDTKISGALSSHQHH